VNREIECGMKNRKGARILPSSDEECTALNIIRNNVYGTILSGSNLSISNNLPCVWVKLLETPNRNEWVSTWWLLFADSKPNPFT
jgi:hypothetical protein